mmetsp:Transcript_86001/g.179838  ORF Transcript_86001/g.179838 Transcript_86001/m.179838 type:complete len:284 (-) Transcript_86001:2088-2939(-)
MARHTAQLWPRRSEVKSTASPQVPHCASNVGAQSSKQDHSSKFWQALCITWTAPWKAQQLCSLTTKFQVIINSIIVVKITVWLVSFKSGRASRWALLQAPPRPAFGASMLIAAAAVDAIAGTRPAAAAGGAAGPIVPATAAFPADASDAAVAVLKPCLLLTPQPVGFGGTDSKVGPIRDTVASFLAFWASWLRQPETRTPASDVFEPMLLLVRPRPTCECGRGNNKIASAASLSLFDPHPVALMDTSADQEESTTEGPPSSSLLSFFLGVWASLWLLLLLMLL